jgi:hypothetical protein
VEHAQRHTLFALFLFLFNFLTFCPFNPVRVLIKMNTMMSETCDEWCDEWYVELINGDYYDNGGGGGDDGDDQANREDWAIGGEHTAKSKSSESVGIR